MLGRPRGVVTIWSLERALSSFAVSAAFALGERLVGLPRW
jgi:hypothetical protein